MRRRLLARRFSSYTALPGSSFHGESVEAMVESCATNNWSPPPPPPAVAEAVAASRLPRWQAAEFGRPMREHFALAPDWTFVNHGAFGAPCKFGLAAAAAWRAHAERQPLKFIDRELFAHLVESTRVVADWMGACPTELVLTPNATAGLNAAVASIVGRLEQGDEVRILRPTPLA